jgi:hypothetical protein
LTLRALAEVDPTCVGGLISYGVTTLTALRENVSFEKVYLMHFCLFTFYFIIHLFVYPCFDYVYGLGKILTHDNLCKRNIVVVEWCCMCKKNGEAVDHLLIHCEVASCLWHYVFTLFGIEWVMPQKVIDLFACWSQVGGRELSIDIWRMAPLCVIWCIWRERNA